MASFSISSIGNLSNRPYIYMVSGATDCLSLAKHGGEKRRTTHKLGVHAENVEQPGKR